MSIDFKSIFNRSGEGSAVTQADRPEATKRTVPRWLLNFVLLAGLVVFGMGVLVLSKHSQVQSAYTGLERSAKAVQDNAEMVIHGLEAVLRSPEALEAGKKHAQNKIIYGELLAELKRIDEQIVDARTYPQDLLKVNLGTLGGSIYSQRYVLYDMLLVAQQKGASALQLMTDDGRDLLVGVSRLRDDQGSYGYLLVSWKADQFLDTLTSAGEQVGFLSLQQAAGAAHFSTLKSYGSTPEGWAGAKREQIRDSLFYVSWSQSPLGGMLSSKNGFLLIGLGLLIFVIGWLRRPSVSAGFEPEPVLIADTQELDMDSLDGDEKRRQADEMAEFNARQLHLETPQPGTEPEPSPASEPLPELLPEAAEAVDKIKPPASIFKAYDIRGIINKTLTADGAWYIGRAVGTLAVRRDADPVVIARDGRISGPSLIKALKKGLLSTGCDVIEIGMVPTGVLYYAAAEFGSGSGVMVTGSHNPPEYNGLKMVVGGLTLSNEEIQGLYKMIQAGDFEEGVGVTRTEGVLSRYQERISSDIQLSRPLKVVADCGNGVGGVNAVSVLQSIGADVAALYDDVDGSFPNHHPDPSEPENLQDLIQAVKHTKADIGVAFDGDADRLGVVTPSGEIIYADRLMILFVRDILSRHPGATIIYDVKCSRHLPAAIREAGGVPLMWKTGHSLIKNKMPEMKSPFAGEMSGHFFFKERWYGVDDGIYAACRLLEILAWKSESPGDILEALPKGVSTPELKIEMQEGENHDFIDALRDHAHFDNAEVNTIDGLRVDFEDGWGLVRASNTTPVLVLRFEADTEEALQRVQSCFRDLLLSLRSDLALPF